MDQFPRSASYREPSHRVTLGSNQGSGQGHPSSELSDRRRFARQLRSPRRETVLYSSPTKDSPFAPLATRSESSSSSVVDSRPSTSSLRSNAPQYVLSSPARDPSLPGPTHQEQLSAVLVSLNTPRSLSAAQTGYARHQSTSHSRPSPPKLSPEAIEHRTDSAQKPPVFGESSLGPGYSTYRREASARTSPVKTTAPLLVAPPHARSSDRRSKSPTPLRIDTEGLNRRNVEMTFSTHDPRYLQTRSAALPLFPTHSLYDRDGDTSPHNRKGFSKAPSQYRHSISTAHPASVYHSSTLPTIDEPRFLSAQNTQPRYPNSESSAHLRRFSNRSQHSQFGASLRPESPSVSSTSAPSPHRAPAKASYYGISQSLHNFAPSSSGKSASPRTPGTSLPTELDDEDFRVHPERAAISRMESLLMLSACRNEAEGRWPVGVGNMNGPGLEHVGLNGGVGYGPDGFPVGFNQRGIPYPGCHAYGSGFAPEFAERSVQTPPDVSHPFGFQAGPVPPNHARMMGGMGGGRGRQRSGSMHVLSPQRHPSRPGSPPRYRQSHVQSPQRSRRQRSASLTVQGLSLEAVKKLRAYENSKGREDSRVDSLGELVGVKPPPIKRYGSTEKAKKVGRSPQAAKTKASLSPPEVATPIETGASLVPRMDATPAVVLSPRAPTPPSPATIPLPPSPPIVLPLSPAQIALPPSPLLELSLSSPPLIQDVTSVVSPLVSSESFMKYRASRGIESPRPVRTRQNTVAGRTVPTLRLISSPEKVERLVIGPSLETAVTNESHVPSGGLDAPDNLKPNPAIERIITPPPLFWSPPPLSPAVRTSAPLLPAAAANVGSSRRPMSVPPPGGDAQVDDVRRAWSCEPPVNVEVRVGRSFAGDWSQNMVIEVSDEEDEEDMVTDVSSSEDESELEEKEAEDVGGITQEPETPKVEECLNEVAERLEQDETVQSLGESVEYVPSGGGASKYYISKGGPSLGSGVNAVEVVQSAIVKLAIDNAGPKHSQRLQNLQAKHMTTPPPSAGLAPRYPSNLHGQPKQPMDRSLYAQTSQVQASINAYFDPPNTRNFQPNVPIQQPSYPKSNPVLDSLRSGLEMRVAASASAVEEAVRARNVSSVVSKQPVRNLATHVPSVATLPPRLQRLHGMHAWTSPKLSLAQLEIPPFSRTSSSLPSAHSHCTPSPMPSPMVSHLAVVQLPVAPEPPVSQLKQIPSPPSVDISIAVSQPTSSLFPDATVAPPKKGRPAHLPDITVGPTPVPAPATAPLTRSKKTRHDKRRSADEATSHAKAEIVASALDPPQPIIPVVESSQEQATPGSSRPADSVGSPPAKSKSRHRNQNWHYKPKKRGASGKQDVSPVASSVTPAPIPSAVPKPPEPINRASPSASVPETTTTANGPRKRKFYRRHKTNKAASTSTGS